MADLPTRYASNLFKGSEKKYRELSAKWLAEKGTMAGFTAANGYFRKSVDGQVSVFGPNTNKPLEGTLVNKVQNFLTSKKTKSTRIQRTKEQSPDAESGVELYDWNKKPKGFDAHHIRMLALYAPFYEGLKDKEKKELTQWFIDEGFPIGDAKENLKLMKEGDHRGARESIHAWMKDNNIEVRPGKPGESNFVWSKDGKLEMVRGGSDAMTISNRDPGKAIMPNLSHMTINERYPAIVNYIKYVQGGVDEQLAKYPKYDHSGKLVEKADPANQTNSLDPNASNITVKPPSRKEINRMKKLGQVWDSETGSFVSQTKAIPGTHFNRNMNLASKGAETVLRELPGSREVIIGAETGMALSRGDVTGAAITALKGNTDPTGSISTIEPLNQRHPYKAIGRDIKLDDITDTLVKVRSDGFGAI